HLVTNEELSSVRSSQFAGRRAVSVPAVVALTRQASVHQSCSQRDRRRESAVMTNNRKVIVHIATSADGYIARPDGDLKWLTSRPAPAGFYGMNAFMSSIDTKLLGRKTYEMSLRLGAKFDSGSRTIVFSRHAPPADAP